MKTILFLSSSYPQNLTDWRGLFIRHLADALARHEQVNLQLWAPPGETHTEITRVTTRDDNVFLADLMKKGGIAHLLRTGGIQGLGSAARLLLRLRHAGSAFPKDIYHINWLQNALPLPADGIPLLISVLGTDMQFLSKPLMKTLVRRILRQHTSIICPNADWMVQPLTHAFGDLASITFTPFGIDPSWYAIDRERTLQPEPARWLVVTRLTKAKLGPLFQWGEDLFNHTERQLHLFGPMQESINLPDWIHYHGPASPESLCRDWFPCAQGLITLSQHAEGRPQVMLEAMAAGLPIIASRLPAHENIVFHRQTGCLCDKKEELAQALTYFEQRETNLDAGKAARSWARQEIGTWDDCAERYYQHYKALLKTSAHA